MTFESWQDWAVALVVLFCVVRVGMSIFYTYRKASRGESPCASCQSECDIKRLYDKKQQSCRAGAKNLKKSCCD